MFLSVREMEVKEVRFDETFPPGVIQFLERRLRQAGPLRVSGSAELIPNTDGDIRIRGRMDVKMEVECDRCLEPTGYPVGVDFDLFYEPVKPGRAGEEIALEPAESNLDFYEGEGLELEDVLREQILLAIPMRTICSEDCKGICPVCGQNRNAALCSCQLDAPDDRWAALRELKAE